MFTSRIGYKPYQAWWFWKMVNDVVNWKYPSKTTTTECKQNKKPEKHTKEILPGSTSSYNWCTSNFPLPLPSVFLPHAKRTTTVSHPTIMSNVGMSVSVFLLLLRKTHLPRFSHRGCCPSSSSVLSPAIFNDEWKSIGFPDSFPPLSLARSLRRCRFCWVKCIFHNDRKRLSACQSGTQRSSWIRRNGKWA